MQITNTGNGIESGHPYWSHDIKGIINIMKNSIPTNLITEMKQTIPWIYILPKLIQEE